MRTIWFPSRLWIITAFPNNTWVIYERIEVPGTWVASEMTKLTTILVAGAAHSVLVNPNKTDNFRRSRKEILSCVCPRCFHAQQLITQADDNSGDPDRDDLCLVLRGLYGRARMILVVPLRLQQLHLFSRESLTVVANSGNMVFECNAANPKPKAKRYWYGTSRDWGIKLLEKSPSLKIAELNIPMSSVC